MTKSKVTQVTVSGLATNPNPNGLPLGSCAVANNVLCRRPGILQPMQATTPLATYTPPTDAADARKFLLDLANNRMVVLFSDLNALSGGPETTTGKLSTYFDNGGFAASTSITSLPIYSDGTTSRNIGFLPGMTQSVYSHFRTFITEKWGVISNFNRWAGLPPPGQPSGGFVTGSSGFLAVNFSCAYRAIYTIEATSASAPYTVVGPASAVTAVTNFSGTTADVNITVVNAVNEPLYSPSDGTLYLNLYRSSQAQVTSPADLADDFRQVAKVPVHAGFGSYSFLDTVTEDARAAGQALYTNASEEGPQASSFAPPSARDICVFKDTVFYANRASLPALNLTVPGTLGTLISQTDRINGVGLREFNTASITSGSATISFTDHTELTGVVAGQTVVGAVQGFFPVATSNRVTVVSVNSGAGTVTVDQQAHSTGSPVTGSFSDMFKITVSYADGTTETGTARIFDFDEIHDVGASLSLPGMRLLTPAIEDDYAVEGATLTLIHTWPAIKRVTQFTVAVTSGNNYFPVYGGNYTTNTSPLPSVVDTRPNRAFYAKTGQPEAVPPASFLDVGAGTILKMWANQSALFVFCSDGLWRITGDGTNWVVDQVDPTAILVHPDAVTSLNNRIYAWILDGIAAVDENGATVISTDAVGPSLRAALANYTSAVAYSWGVTMAADQFYNELWLNVFPNLVSAPSPTYVYNDDTKQFTTQSFLPFVAVVFNPYALQMRWLQLDINTAGQTVYVAPNPSLWLPPTIWFNPIQAQDKGTLKQWMDVNYFFTKYQYPIGPSADPDTIQAYFSTAGDSTDTTIGFNTIDASTNSIVDLHFLVPRRTALGDQLQVGVGAIGVISPWTGVLGYAGFSGYWELQGFTARYRVASDTLRR